MKTALAILVLLFSLNSSIAQDCIFLSDGKYKVVPDEEFIHYEEYFMEVKGDVFISNQDSLQVFKIVKNYCFFKLQNTVLDENLSEVDKMFNEQSLGYKIIESKKDEYHFVLYSISLNCQVYSGRFIKIED